MKAAFKLKTLVLNTAYTAGRFLGQNKPAKKIICYHNLCGCGNRYCVSFINFKKQINLLSKSASFVSLAEILNPEIKCDKVDLVALTFDDGFKGVKQAVSFLKSKNITPTIFVLSDRKNANRKELENADKFLSGPEIRSLLKMGWILGSHSATHANFKNLNKQMIQAEINASKKLLEKEFKVPINYLAYPKGATTKAIINAAKKSGYQYAFSINPGSVDERMNHFSVPRTIIDSTHSLADFPSVYSETTFKIRRLADKLHLWELLLK
jgi:peptidoglycan/xylan/chitin deacetylase (PgdA/CDA1 family)